MVQNSSAIYYKKIKQNATKKACKKFKEREKEKKTTVHFENPLECKNFLEYEKQTLVNYRK